MNYQAKRDDERAVTAAAVLNKEFPDVWGG